MDFELIVMHAKGRGELCSAAACSESSVADRLQAVTATLNNWLMFKQTSEALVQLSVYDGDFSSLLDSQHATHILSSVVWARSPCTLNVHICNGCGLTAYMQLCCIATVRVPACLHMSASTAPARQSNLNNDALQLNDTPAMILNVTIF